MRFEKGNNANPKGRPPGSISEKMRRWEKLGDYLTTDAAERAKLIMSTASDKDFMKWYMELLEYFKPKQQRTEIVDERTPEEQYIVLPDGNKLLLT